MTADPAVGAAGRAGVPPVLPATGAGSDYAQLSRTVKRAGLLRRRPVYYSFKIGLNLVLLAARAAGRSTSKAKRPLSKPRASSRSLTSTTTAASSTFAASLFPRRPAFARFAQG